MPPHFQSALAAALAACCACAAPERASPSVEAPSFASEPGAAIAATPSAPEHDVAPAPPLPACVLDGAGVFYVAGEDPARPRVRYADGQMGPLDHCAIRNANALSRRIPPVYVNGSPIGFC